MHRTSLILVDDAFKSVHKFCYAGMNPDTETNGCANPCAECVNFRDLASSRRARTPVPATLRPASRNPPSQLNARLFWLHNRQGFTVLTHTAMPAMRGLSIVSISLLPWSMEQLALESVFLPGRRFHPTVIPPRNRWTHVPAQCIGLH